VHEAVELSKKLSEAAGTCLAHSPPRPGAPGDPYARHIEGVRIGARERAEEMLRYATPPIPALLEAIEAAATFHDLGKLDPANQAALKRGRGNRLPWDHIDAGVAHLSALQDWMAAWLVRAHHAPGLPEKQEHFNPDNLGRRLRGRRHDDEEPERHGAQIEQTDQHLGEYLSLHETLVGAFEFRTRRPIHGLAMRLALSCLVDADHSDTACFDTGRPMPAPAAGRWAERLEALRRYVYGLPEGETDSERARNRQRRAFFEACIESQIEAPVVACEGPVGIGKTTAVAGYLIRRALRAGPELRRLIVVAPYTNILSQTAEVLRRALVLPGEEPDQIVVEHHHRADFESQEDRDLAVLWRAPVVLTTAVSFFETLAGCDPASLRKFHAVPGSAIFLDEAHAALPTKLWPQNWRWLLELARSWSCPVVLASGSLVRFWEDRAIVGEPVRLPELLPPEQSADVLSTERRRIKYEELSGGRVVSIRELTNSVCRTPGPRLVILNTVQNAGIVARAMRDAGLDVLHLSTALTPRDREAILGRIKRRLEFSSLRDWTLVATSCVEAGVDLSFRSGFRERFCTASIIQVGGRVNRHGERGEGNVFDFALADEGVTQHPAAAVTADVLRELMAAEEFNRRSPADIVTDAMRRELLAIGGLGADSLLKAEEERNYPLVAEHGRVIDADTRIVVVDEALKKQIAEGQRSYAAPRISFIDLLRGSVQIWARRINELRLERLPGRRELYAWNDLYDPEFLGYMAGVLRNQDFLRQGGAII
jgi:CRISPR-associated endonuclease/helicase Cas3